MQSTNLNAILFAKVSIPAEQSINIQISTLTNYARTKNFKVTEIFKMESKGTTRKTHQAMISYLKKQENPTALIADSMYKILRNDKTAIELDALCKTGKITLHFVKEGIIIDNAVPQSQDQLVWDFSILMAKYYFFALKRRIRQSLNSKKITNQEIKAKASN